MSDNGWEGRAGPLSPPNDESPWPSFLHWDFAARSLTGGQQGESEPSPTDVEISFCYSEGNSECQCGSCRPCLRWNSAPRRPVLPFSVLGAVPDWRSPPRRRGRRLPYRAPSSARSARSRGIRFQDCGWLTPLPGQVIHLYVERRKRQWA